MKEKFILSLGTAQDGGYPHVGCINECCIKAINNPNLKRLIASIAIINKEKQKYWMIDISPDINEQLRMINNHVKKLEKTNLSGIFLTHAHIGHYAGLLNLGLEVMDLFKLPVYVLPKMKVFLENNIMFKQLIENNHIVIKVLEENKKINLIDDIYIKPFLVPHRNELSETAGYNIQSNNNSIIYIPDIDSWDEWDIQLSNLLKKHDILILDGTFYSKSEIKNRNISKIPHPSMIETIDLTKKCSLSQKNKIYFTHLNHTNNAICDNTKEYRNVITSGYNILKDKQIFNL